MPTAAPQDSRRAGAWWNGSTGQSVDGGTMQALLHDIRLTLVAPSRTPRMAVLFGGATAIWKFFTGRRKQPQPIPVADSQPLHAADGKVNLDK